MNKLRKYFNIPSKQQRLLIEEGYKKIVELANKEIQNLQDLQPKFDGTCPKCNNTSIIDKIESGVEINHCHECGHEWKKYKPYYSHSRNVIYDWLTIIELNPSLTLGVIDLFKMNGISAESVFKAHRADYWSIELQQISLQSLRKYFKSVYDER